MSVRPIRRVLAAGITALALVGVGVGVANAADSTTDPTFGGTFLLADSSDGTPFAVGDSIPIGASLVSVVAQGDFSSRFSTTAAIAAGATGSKTFLAPQGSENNISAWIASNPGAVPASGLLLPNVSPLGQPNPPGAASTAMTTGGDYSIGFAYTKNSGNTIVGSQWFVHIHAAPGGTWTYTQVDGGGTVTPPPPPAGISTDQGLSAQVTSPPVVDGVLSFVAPAASTSTIGNPTIVGGLSTSTGMLGHLTIQDGRAASKPGWTLTTTAVAPFVNGATSIANTQLGLAPKTISGTPTTLGAAQTAGSATYPSKFAELAAGTAGDSVLDADLTFVAPTGSPAGTYTSTLTLTLVSK